MPRINIEKHFMDICNKIGELSYCKRAKVGALLVRDGRIISSGYNGTIQNVSNNCEEGDETNNFVVHAEVNAIAHCAKNGISLKGTDLYCTYAPCIDCAKLIIQSGIVRLYYNKIYRIDDGYQLLLKGKIKMIKC